MKYTDYFDINSSDDCGEVSMDEFIDEAMRIDLVFSDVKSELSYFKMSRATLANEVCTCYEFLKENNLLSAYHTYRDGF